jgi:hypothetical protein
MSHLQKDFLRAKLGRLPQLPALRDPLSDAPSDEHDPKAAPSLLEEDEDETDGLGQLG